MNRLKRAKKELQDLNFWFKSNKNLQGTDLWNANISKGIDLTEIVKDL